MRVLNRIATVTDTGLEYEPDPRHIELLARDLGFGVDGKPALTPGQKPQFEDVQNIPEDNIEDMLHAIKDAKKSCLRIRFDDTPTFLDPVLNSHFVPNDHLLNQPIGSLSSMQIPQGHCRFTGLDMH